MYRKHTVELGNDGYFRGGARGDYGIQSGASYIIFKDGDVIKAKNGTTGQIEFSGTDAATVIQGIINKLTGGGKIFIKNGNYILTNTLEIKGLSDIDIEGESWNTVLTPSGAFGAIKLGGSESERVDRIKIYNLCIDGTNQSADTGDWSAGYDLWLESDYGIGIDKYAYDIEISKTYIKDTGSDSISGWYTYGNVLVENNLIEGCRGYWASVHPHSGNQSWKVVNNWIKDAKTGGIRHARAIVGNIVTQVDGGFARPALSSSDSGGTIAGNYVKTSIDSPGIDVWASNTSVVGNTLIGIAGQNQNGIFLGMNTNMSRISIVGNTIYGYASAILLLSVDCATVIGNAIYEPKNNGIVIKKGVNNSTHITVIGNSIYKTTSYDGIQTENADYLIIKGNIITDINRNGIRLYNVTNSIISGNIVKNITGQGISYSNSTSLIFYQNHFVSVGTPFYDGGGNTEVTIYRNTGYVTENSGTATIPNTSSSVTVNHGLATTPTKILLTGTHSEVANCWVTNVTTTQFTINAPSAVTADRDVYWYAEV